MSCKCQECGKQYRVDISVTNRLWEKIKPKGKPVGGGLLCGSCICHKVEFEGEYKSFQLIEEKE